jgi:hypothetical protein
MLFENLPYKYTVPAILATLTQPIPVQSLAFVSNFQYTSQKTSANLSEAELTRMCMSISEISLTEDWENEDDAHWASFTPID